MRKINELATFDIFLCACSTMTMKQCRGYLEQDMGLPEQALRGHKDLVEALVDKVWGHSLSTIWLTISWCILEVKYCTCRW